MLEMNIVTKTVPWFEKTLVNDETIEDDLGNAETSEKYETIQDDLGNLNTSEKESTINENVDETIEDDLGNTETSEKYETIEDDLGNLKKVSICVEWLNVERSITSNPQSRI